MLDSPTVANRVAELGEVAGAALPGIGDGTLHLTTRHAVHRHEAVLSQVRLGTDLGREGVDDEVADERVVERLPVVAAA